MNSQVFVILFWFLVEHFKLSARTKDVWDTRDAFLESVYPYISVLMYEYILIVITDLWLTSHLDVHCFYWTQKLLVQPEEM